jgi:hypothetical protein
MSARTLYRLGGLTLMVALPLQVVGLFIHPPHLLQYYAQPTFATSHVLLTLSEVAATLGIVAAYVRIAQEGGKWALAAFVLNIVTFELLIDLTLFEAFGAPVLERDPVAREVLAPGGYYVNGELGTGGRGILGTLSVLAALTLAVAIFRTSAFPRVTAYLLIASIPLPVIETLVFLPFLGGPQHRIPQEAIPAPISPLSIGYYAFFLALGWMGWQLWRRPP